MTAVSTKVYVKVSITTPSLFKERVGVRSKMRAILYGIETKRLKEAVRRNLSRFPEDFMFELNE